MTTSQPLPNSQTPPIDLPAFSGPLDLLLYLIERNELDITAISLGKVAEQYLQQVAELKEQRIDQLIDFLVIGAQLALIKSRALLPKPPPILAEQEEEEDPAEALARRLRSYKRFKEVASWFAQREAKGWRHYIRVAPSPYPTPVAQLDTSNLTAEVLYTAVLDALRRAERLDDSVRVAQKRTITIEGQIGRLRRLMHQHGRISFGRFLSPSPSRAELSVSLLAILELVKRREIEAQQSEMFGHIDIVATLASPSHAPNTKKR